MLPLAFSYLRWHYTYALRDHIGIVGNFVWFIQEFFSIGLMARTLFVPFHRLNESLPFDIEHPEAWAETIVANSMMRLVGALLRSILIVLGVVALFLTVLIGVFSFVLWLLAPLLVAIATTTGVLLILTA